MPLTVVGTTALATGADGASPVTAAYEAGDLVLVFMAGSGTATPTVPTGYTSLGNASGNSNSIRVVYKIAETSSSGDTLTVSNCRRYTTATFRGHNGVGPCAAKNGANTGTAAYDPITMADLSWLIFGENCDASGISPGNPADSVQLASASQIELHMSTTVRSSYAGEAVPSGSNSTGWSTFVLELKEIPPPSPIPEISALTTTHITTSGARHSLTLAWET